MDNLNNWIKKAGLALDEECPQDLYELQNEIEFFSEAEKFYLLQLLIREADLATIQVFLEIGLSCVFNYLLVIDLIQRPRNDPSETENEALLEILKRFGPEHYSLRAIQNLINQTSQKHLDLLLLILYHFRDRMPSWNLPIPGQIMRHASLERLTQLPEFPSIIRYFNFPVSFLKRISSYVLPKEIDFFLSDQGFAPEDLFCPSYEINRLLEQKDFLTFEKCLKFNFLNDQSFCDLCEGNLRDLSLEESKICIQLLQKYEKKNYLINLVVTLISVFRSSTETVEEIIFFSQLTYFELRSKISASLRSEMKELLLRSHTLDDEFCFSPDELSILPWGQKSFLEVYFFYLGQGDREKGARLQVLEDRYPDSSQNQASDKNLIQDSSNWEKILSSPSSFRFLLAKGLIGNVLPSKALHEKIISNGNLLEIALTSSKELIWPLIECKPDLIDRVEVSLLDKPFELHHLLRILDPSLIEKILNRNSSLDRETVLKFKHPLFSCQKILENYNH